MSDNPFDVFAADMKAAVPANEDEGAAPSGPINIMAPPAPAPVPVMKQPQQNVMNSAPNNGMAPQMGMGMGMGMGQQQPGMMGQQQPPAMGMGMNGMGGMGMAPPDPAMNGGYGQQPPAMGMGMGMAPAPAMGMGMGMAPAPAMGMGMAPAPAMGAPAPAMGMAPPAPTMGMGMGMGMGMAPAPAPVPNGMNGSIVPSSQPSNPYGMPPAPPAPAAPGQGYAPTVHSGMTPGSNYPPTAPAPVPTNPYGAPAPAPLAADPFGAPPAPLAPVPGPPAPAPVPMPNEADPWGAPPMPPAPASPGAMVPVPNNMSNDDPFGVFGAGPGPAPGAMGMNPSDALSVATPGPDPNRLNQGQILAAADGGDPWGDMGFGGTPATAPSASVAENGPVGGGVGLFGGSDALVPAGGDATHQEGELPPGGEWYDARIFTPTLGVMFFKPQELTDSLFLQTDRSLVNTLDDRPVVAFIVEGSSARAAGVELGHVLLKVNGIDVKNPKEASRLIKEGPRPLPLLFYVPDTTVVVAEGEHMVKYDTRETGAPNSAKDWKPKYVVIGGIIAQPWMMNMYRSKVRIVECICCDVMVL